MVEVVNGIGYSARTQAAFMYKNDAARASAPKDNSSSASSGAWVNWGENNNLPGEMAKLIESCGVLSSVIESKVRISIGKGVEPFLLTDKTKDGEVLEPVFDDEIDEWLEVNDMYEYARMVMTGLIGYGWNAGQLVLRKKEEYIARVKAPDVVHCRLRKMNDQGVIESLFMKDDWGAMGSSGQHKEITLLDEGYELEELMRNSTGSNREFAILHRYKRNGRLYYPTPLWYAAKKWVDVAISIPEFKSALHQNQMHIKYIIHISEYYWKKQIPKWDSMNADEKTRVMQETYNRIEESLVGADKAGKTIVSGTYVDPITKIESKGVMVEVLDDKFKDGKMLPDSSAANSEIYFASLMNPSMMGSGQPGGPYANNAGGSNVRESYLTQMMMLEPERKQIVRLMNLVSRFNKWKERLEVERNFTISTVNGNTATTSSVKRKPKLVWRFPSGLLTTLDTGKSTKQENL